MTIKYKVNEEGKRPWGEWKVVSVGKQYVVKRIIINPKSSLSLQMHHHRAEHWVIAQGTAMVTVGENRFEVKAGKAVDIPKKTKHRIENLTDKPVEFVEIQMGKILNEEDIVRYKDAYGRE